jgi:REP element-mobilizing transposase RayT
MSRPTRIEYPGAIYHVMGRGIEGKKVFPEDEHRERFLRFVGQAVEGGDLVVHAYCLMTTHYHLLLETPRAGLGRWMQYLLGVYAQWFNIREERFGHLWQSRYKAILVEKGPYLSECSRYIHLNPNRAGLSRPAERWKWSSYRNYVGGPGRPAMPWVTTETVLAGLPSGKGLEKEARRAYREYVESGKGEPPISPFERATAGLVLGSASFVAWARDLLKSRPATEDEPALRLLRKTCLADPERIEALVKEEFGDPRTKGKARRILAALLVHSSGLRAAEVSRRLGVSRSAVSKSVIREGASNPYDRTVFRKIQVLAVRVRTEAQA